MAKTRLLKMPDVCARLACSRRTVYALIERGELPSPVRPGGRAIRWPECEIEAYLDRLRAARDGREAA